MAYNEGYRASDPHQPPYSSSYDSTYDQRPYDLYQRPSNAQYPPEYEGPPSRASSKARSVASQQPIREAVNNAFDKSDAASRVDPDIVAQIAAEVKKTILDDLKSSGVGVTASAGQAQPPQPQAYHPHSPDASTTASFPPRDVYTPPSPNRHETSSYGTNSPDPVVRDTLFDGTGDTPTPRHERTSPIDIPGKGQPKSRPVTAARMPTEPDLTPIEKMWQLLFDADGKPTPRLGQFLRGLALHIINDYEPKKSLVISPAKMLKFYEDVKLSEEIYPWKRIFGELSYQALSKIYRNMRCQHHFIQEHHTEQPFIPALTPEGFEEWMTAMIQAYPDTEYQRLSKAVLDMPISNADDCKERFPKELPRRLLPSAEHLHAQQRTAAIFSAEGVGPLRRAPSFPPPPPGPPASAPPAKLDRDRSPYGGPAIDTDDDDEPLAVPIERERKPYSAAPGGGKVYNDNPSALRSDADNHTRSVRAQTMAGQTPYVPPSSSAHHRTSSQQTGRRARSPSFSRYGHASDSKVGDIPPYYATSNIYDEDDNRRFAREAERRRNDWARRQAEEDPAAAAHRQSTAGLSDSSYGSQPRSVHDEDYYKGGGRGYDSRGWDSGRRY